MSLRRRVRIEIAQTAKAIQHPVRVRGSPTWINSKFGHPLGIKARSRLRLEVRAVQRRGELRHLGCSEVSRRTVPREALIVLTKRGASENRLAYKARAEIGLTAEDIVDAVPRLVERESRVRAR